MNGGDTVRVMCVEWNGVCSNLAVHFDLFFLLIFSKFTVCIYVRLHLCRNMFQVVYLRGFKHNIMYVYHYSLNWQLLFGSFAFKVNMDWI